MIEALKEKYQFYIILLIWWLCGTYAGPLFYVVVPLTLLLFWRRDMHEEMFIGFFFLLILSDSLEFAKNIKDVYSVMLAILLVIGKPNLSFTNKLCFWFIPYLIIAFICLFYAVNFFTSFQKTVSYLLLLIIVPNYVQNIYMDKGAVFLKNMVLFSTVFLLLGLIMRFIRPEMVIWEGRYHGVFIFNPNGLGIFITLFFLFFSLVSDLHPQLFSKTERNFIYALTYVIVYMCGSRNAAVTILIFLLFKFLYKISPFIGFIIFLCIVAAYEYIAANAGNIIMSLGLQNFFRIETLENASGRSIAWKFAWDNIQQTAFYIGNGIGYTDHLFKIHFMELAMLGHAGNAHNSYLTIWLDTGLIGLLMYLTAFVIGFIKGAKNSILALPIMYAILFSIYFESWLSASLNPYTIQVFAILTILTSDAIREKKQENIISLQ